MIGCKAGEVNNSESKQQRAQQTNFKRANQSASNQMGAMGGDFGLIESK